MQNGIPFSILIVDDDSDDLLLIDEAFEEIGYAAEVKKFLNGKALLQYLDSVEPHLYPSLIVLDNTLPELNASEMLSVLKRNPAYKNIAVIVYTTLLTPSIKEQLMAEGAYTCLEKGNSLKEIVQVAKELKEVSKEVP